MTNADIFDYNDDDIEFDVRHHGTFNDRSYETKKSKTTWWWDDYNYDYRGKYSSDRGSRAWMSQFKTAYDSDYWESRNKNDAYQDLLDQLQNSVNLLAKDKEIISLKWSDNQDRNTMVPNKYGVQKIYLSPNNLIGENNKIDETVLDAMTGKVYLAASLHKTINATTLKKVKKFKKNIEDMRERLETEEEEEISSEIITKTENEIEVAEIAIMLWEALETSIGRKAIIEEWAGFSAYIASDAERSSTSKADIQKTLDDSVENPNVYTGIAGIAWNLLHAIDPVQLPECYHKLASLVEKQMEKEIKPTKRFDVCLTLANESFKIINNYKNLNLKIYDATLLGETVSNNVDKNLSVMKAKNTKDDENSNSGSNAITCDDSECNSKVGRKYKLVPFELSSIHKIRYFNVLRENKFAIQAIRNSLAFRNNEKRTPSYGHRSGDIDENSLYKIRFNDDTIMTKSEVETNKKIALCLLVDESGSMGYGYPESRIDSARDVAIVLAESLKQIDKIDLSIYGHSAEEPRIGPDCVTIREYVSPRKNNIDNCMAMQSRRENLDSYAVLHVANLFNKDYADYPRKIMFVISDGEPCGRNYGGTSAHKHMRKVVKACYNAAQIEVYGIAVAKAFGDHVGSAMYGEGRYIILDDVSSSLSVMTRFIRQIANK